MNEFFTTVLGYAVLGAVVMLAYAIVFRARPRLRHIAAWPVVLGHMFWTRPLPGWLLPAPRSLRRRYRV